MSVKLNRGGEAIPVVTINTVTEGRMVILAPSSQTYDYGSFEDLPGVRLPNNSTEAQKADYMLRFREDPRQGFLDGLPGEDTYENRDGWGRTTPNAPATGVTVYGVNPGNQETPQVIASGVRAIAYTAATFTVQSGMYVYSATLAPGIELEVTNISDDTAAEAGKLKVGSTNPVAIVERFDTSTLDLTVRQLRR